MKTTAPPAALVINEQPMPVELPPDMDGQALLALLGQRLDQASLDAAMAAEVLTNLRETGYQQKRALFREIVEEVLDNMDAMLDPLDPDTLQGPAANWHRRMSRMRQKILDLLHARHCKPMDMTSPAMNWVEVDEMIRRDDLPDGRILSVIRRGYLLDGEVLRKAVVSMVSNPAGGRKQD